ncbi:MAG: hypothetical protein FE048_03300 [Thermoplasmata archaeon]|nr:MAG: hypothetical protein FE048_03300 [Thermoplasmata archaeon]
MLSGKLYRRTSFLHVAKKGIFPMILLAFLFLTSQFLALAATKPFHKIGMKAFENPDDPMNIVQVILIIIIFTFIILLIAKYRKNFIRILIFFVFFISTFYIFQAIFLLFLPQLALPVSFLFAVGVILLLIKYPEWYIVDSFGILMTAGIIAIFGISLSIPLILALLFILAIYDAISVYKTKHMITLADTVVGESIPLLMVAPKKKNYSFLKEKGLEEERDALFMGLGDVVIPGILASASYFAGSFVVSFFTILGSFIGFIILMTLVSKGKPQAGLPLLNGGAILGYVISSYLLFQKFIGFS